MLFDEDPFEVFKRNIYVHIFHEPDPQGLLDLGLPADRLMFGSDFPHPEGLGDPLGYSEVVEDLPQEDAGADHGRHHRQGAQGRQVRQRITGGARGRPRGDSRRGSGVEARAPVNEGHVEGRRTASALRADLCPKRDSRSPESGR